MMTRRRRLHQRVSWRDPGPPVRPRKTGALACRVLGTGGAPVLLVHGLLGSSRFWGADYDTLASDGRLIVVDLLGFGASPRPDGPYDLDAHVDALLATLDEHGVSAAVTVGAHSLGCVLALGLATRAPDRVAGIVMFGPPLYTSTTQARKRIGALGGFARLLAFDTPLAERVCGWMCNHRALAARLTVLLHPDLPPAVARDGVQHNWVSYSGTMRNVILTINSAILARDALTAMRGIDSVGAQHPDVALRIITGDQDRVSDPAVLEELGTDPAVRVEHWPGGHDLPLRNPQRCLQAITAMRHSATRAP